jgi:TP901 family phage tail tape measure protein
MAIDKIIVEFQAETTKLKKELDVLKGRLGNVETAAEKGGKNITKSFENAGTGVNKLGANLKNLAGTVGLALGAAEVINFGKQSVQAASAFEKSMGNVGTLVDTNVESISSMGKAVQEIAARTPVELGQLSSALYDIRSAGVSAGDAMSVLESSAELGVAGLATTAEAANIMTSAVNAFAAEGLSAEQISDILFKTVKAGKTTLAELTAQFGGVAPAAAAAGVSLADLQASTAAITTLGTPAAAAQTQLKQALTEMQKPGKELSNIFKQLGAKDGIDLIKTSGGLGNAFKLIKEEAEASGMTVAQVTGSVETASAILALGGTVNESYTATLADMTTGANAVNVAFEKQAQTADAQFQLMQNAFQNIQIQLGQALMPALLDGIETLNEFVSAVDWNMVFGELGEIFDSAAEPIRQLYSSLADIFEAFTQNMSAGEKTAGVFDALGVAINVVTTPMRVISKLFKHLTENIIVPLIETGQDLITWFNEVREGGGFVGAIFNGIASAAGAVIDKLEGVAQFIGIIDSDEEKLHKNRMQRDADFKKSNEEYAARNFKQQKQRTKDEERIMALQAKRAYLGQKLTKEEEAELKKLTAATAANTDKTKGDTKAKEIAKTAVEKLNEELGKLKTAQENATFAGDIEKASEYQKAISKLENQLAIFKNKLEEVRGGIVGDEDLEALEIESNLSLSEGVDALIAAELSKLKEDLGTFTDEDPIELPVILTIQEKAKQDALKKVGEIESKMGEVFGAVNSVLGPAMDALNGYFDLRLNNLEKEKNERLANENLTAEERLRIEEEYEAKKNEILAEQFEVSRGSQIIQAIMSSAQAALNAFTSTALLFAPAAPAAAAAAAAFGAVQIGIIAAQPNPYKFFEGTDYLQLGGNPKGKDTIPVMAHEGEAIIPTGKNLQYPGLAKSWIDGSLDGYINKNFVRPALMEQQRQAEEDFADRLAASMALQMSSNFDDYRLFRATKEQTAVLRDGFQTMKQTRKKLRGA